MMRLLTIQQLKVVKSNQYEILQAQNSVLVAVGQSTRMKNEDNSYSETTSDDYYARSGDMLEATSTDSVASSVSDASPIMTTVEASSKIATQQNTLIEKEEVKI